MSRIITILLAGALLATIGCASKTEAEAPAFINANCPMMGKEVSPDGGSYDWNGKEVGFCCDGCAGKFEALSDAEKQAALDKYNK